MLNRFRCLQSRRVGLAPSASKSIAARLPAFSDAPATNPPAAASAANASSGISRNVKPPGLGGSGLSKNSSSLKRGSLSSAKPANNSSKADRKNATESTVKSADSDNIKSADSANIKSADSAIIKSADSANIKGAESAEINGTDLTNVKLVDSSVDLDSADLIAAPTTVSKSKVDRLAVDAAELSDGDSSQASFASAQQDLSEGKMNVGVDQQFDALFDSVMQTVSNCTAEELCLEYLKTRVVATSASETVKQLQRHRQPTTLHKKNNQDESRHLIGKQPRGRKRKAESTLPGPSAVADSSQAPPIRKPPVDFQFADGTWIQCCECGKWRHAADIAEPCQVPDTWRCADSADPRQNDCQLAELTEYFYSQGTNFALCNKYVAGSLVWARVQGHPYWPAIVEVDNDYGTFFELEAESNDVSAYHVTFLGRSPSRAWISDSRIRPFKDAAEVVDLLPSLGKGAVPKAGSAAESELRCVADEAANVVAKLDFNERLRRYGFFAGNRVPINRLPAAQQPKRKKAKLQAGKKQTVDGGNCAKAAKTRPAKPVKPRVAAVQAEETDYAEAATLEQTERNIDNLGDAMNGEGDAMSVDLLAARDRFRRRVSQLCQMRSCDDGDVEVEGEDEAKGDEEDEETSEDATED